MLAGSPAAALQTASVADVVSPPQPSSGPYPAINGSAQAMALQSIEPVRIAPTIPVQAYPVPSNETGPHGALRAPSGIQYPYSPPSAATSRMPPVAVSNTGEDDFSIPGLPKRKLMRQGQPAGGSRTLVTIIVSVVATLALGAGAVWILGLLPSQRRETEVRDLMYRAEDAYRGHRYTHESDENDVEDLTDAVLALAPQHGRARELRSAASLALRNQAVELANGGHPEQALPLLHRAVRLSDDPEIRALLTQVETAAHAPTPTTGMPTTTTNPPPVAPPNGTNPPAAPHNGSAHPTHPHNPLGANPPDEETPPQHGPDGTPAHPTFTPGQNGNVPTHPTFTPGRTPGSTNNQSNNPPVVQQPPANPPDNPPQMVGGPSQTDPTPPPQPPSDPNAGGTAF
jgi:hypothetical protein